MHVTAYFICCDIIFFFNDTATTEIYTLSLHDALPICPLRRTVTRSARSRISSIRCVVQRTAARSEEHTSELQSRLHLVCRLLLEKKKKSHTHALSATPPKSIACSSQ